MAYTDLPVHDTDAVDSIYYSSLHADAPSYQPLTLPNQLVYFLCPTSLNDGDTDKTVNE